MYKLIATGTRPDQNPSCILNMVAGIYIPFDPDNTDYQAYLKHIAEGGVVLPADDNEQTA